MNLNIELKRYAFTFASFLINNIGEAELEKINSIILFGSVAQNRASETSDVDIFFETALSKSKTNRLRTILLGIKEDFLLSSEALKFKSKKIYNEISFVVGNLNDWPEMKKSVSSAGLIIYGKYRTSFMSKGLKHQLVFFWDSIGKNRGAFLNKLYGYRIKKKRYSGFLNKKGAKIGKSAALIPAEYKDEFIEILKKYEVEYKIIDSYTE